MSKRIAIIAPAYPLRGGLSAPTERLAQEFQNAGHSVVIYTFSLQYPSLLFPGKTQLSPDPSPKDLKIKVVINSINPLNWFKVGRMIKAGNYDCVVIRFWIPFMAPCLGTIARIVRKNSRVVAILDNVIPHEKRVADKLLIAYFIKSCDGFLAMSKQVVNDLLQFSPKAAYKLLPFPVYDNYGEAVSKEEACMHLNISAAGKYILFFGFIRKYKGLDLLLEAMKDERIKQTGVKLIIAGEFYEDKSNYDLTGDNILLFDDYIPESQVKYYFGAADVVVQPYRTATQSGITQIAYQFDKPMIVTNVGGLPEIVADGKTGFVVNVSSKEIADAVIRFYSTDSSILVESVKQEKKKYSWEKHTEAILKLAE